MSHFVEKLGIAQVENGGADPSAQYLFSEWRRNNGYLSRSSNLNALSPNLIAFQDFGSVDDSPEILFWGNSTLFARHFSSFQQSYANPKYALAKDYRRLVVQGYRAAAEGEPYFDVIGTGDLLGTGQPDITYERLLIPFKNRYDSPYLICYTIERRTIWKDPRSYRPLPDKNSKQSTNRYRL